MLPGAHYGLADSNPVWNAQAEDEYKAAIKVNQYDEMAWRQLVGIMAAKGDFKTADEDYRNALALLPKDSDAQTGLAIVLISLNRTNELFHLWKVR